MHSTVALAAFQGRLTTPIQLSDNITYWRNNSYPIAFQNHAAGFILTGNNITISGNGTGGINGNGDVWYTAEAGVTQPGRPMVRIHLQPSLLSMH